MATKLEQLKEWAKQNVTMIDLLPNNSNLQVTTRLIDVLEDEVDEKYYLSEEKTKKLTLDNDLGGKLNMYDYNERDRVHSVNKVSPTLNTMQGGDRQPKVAVIGNTSNTGYKSHDVHDTDGLSPTVAARDYKGPKQIAVREATKQGVVIDDTQGYDGVRYYKGVAPTLRSSRSGLKTVVAPKEESGEVNQDVVIKDKSLRFTDDGFHTHRNDEKKSSIQGTHVTYKEGKTHALTSNHVPMTLQDGEVNQGVVIGVGHHPFSKKREFNGYGLICPTLIATDYKAPKTVLTNNLQIRKLTPLECWRLQGFTDEQFYKAKNSGVSNSQLYKQSGNAITISVADAIIKKITEG